jgi:hypothetical protein
VTDLAILRAFLATGGYHNILPADEMCVPLLPLFRQNRPPAPPGMLSVPLNLEIVFPVAYPRHHLVGFNHQALVDCQQTRLMLIAFDELCKPVKKRDSAWKPPSLEVMSQRSIQDYFSPGKGRSFPLFSVSTAADHGVVGSPSKHKRDPDSDDGHVSKRIP